MKTSVFLVLFSILFAFSTGYSEIPGMQQDQVNRYRKKSVVYGCVAGGCLTLSATGLIGGLIGAGDIGTGILLLASPVYGAGAVVFGSMMGVNIHRYKAAKGGIQPASVDLYPNGVGLTCSF
jgi:hypothetical protein